MTDQTSPDDTPKDVPTPQQPDANGVVPAVAGNAGAVAPKR